MTAVLLPPAGGGAALLPLTQVARTAPAPALQARLIPAGGAGALLPVQGSRYLRAALPLPAASAGFAPALVLFGLPAPPRQPQPAWQRDVEGWAIARELQVHAQALWQYGELVFWALMWSISDFENGLVMRCFRCWDGDRNLPAMQAPEQQIAAAYGQGNQYGCPVCYNSAFALPEQMSALPGLRALIVRPAIFDDFDRAQSRQAKGIFNTAGLNIESTPDFRVRNGDYVFRADNTRFQLKVPHRITLRTGFALPWQSAAAITYNFAQASLEDPLTVAYQIPPPAASLASILGTYTRIPVTYNWAEVINGPLIPAEEPPPAATGSPQPDVTFPLQEAT